MRSVTTASIRAPPVRWPFASNTVSAPPRWACSCARTRSGGSTVRQHTHVAFARLTVPVETSFSVVGSKISKPTVGPAASRPGNGRSARFRFSFLQSQNDRTSGISAPQFGDSQRTVRAHR